MVTKKGFTKIMTPKPQNQLQITEVWVLSKACYEEKPGISFIETDEKLVFTGSFDHRVRVYDTKGK